MVMLESPLQPKKMTWRGRSNFYIATLKGYGEVQILSDVGSGLNENRNGFLRLLEMVAERKVSKVTEIEVVNSEELVDELDNHRVPFCRETLRGEIA